MKRRLACLGLFLVGVFSGFALRSSLPVARSDGASCVPGDCNGDGTLDVSDPVHLLGYLFLGSEPPVACQVSVPAEAPAVAVIVRHAEKASGTDPGLTPEGQERAQRLARMLAVAAIDHLVASELRRTRETLQPLADLRGMALEMLEDPADVVAMLRALPPGETAVVCHHSYTIPAILRDLGVDGWSDIPVSGDHYDEFLVVLLGQGAKTRLLRLHY